MASGRTSVRTRLTIGILCLLAGATAGTTWIWNEAWLEETRYKVSLEVAGVNDHLDVYVDCRHAGSADPGEQPIIDLGWLETDDFVSLHVQNKLGDAAYEFTLVVDGRRIPIRRGRPSHHGFKARSHATVFTRSYTGSGREIGKAACGWSENRLAKADEVQREADLASASTAAARATPSRTSNGPATKESTGYDLLHAVGNRASLFLALVVVLALIVGSWVLHRASASPVVVQLGPAVVALVVALQTAGLVLDSDARAFTAAGGLIILVTVGLVLTSGAVSQLLAKRARPQP